MLSTLELGAKDAEAQHASKQTAVQAAIVFRAKLIIAQWSEPQSDCKQLGTTKPIG
jgi:hypothetical protein